MTCFTASASLNFGCVLTLKSHQNLNQCNYSWLGSFNQSLSSGRRGRWHFLTKPFSKNIESAITINKTRAMPSVIWMWTPQRPRSIYRTTGMPIGQPNLTVFISAPMSFLSSILKPRSQSRTGSLPKLILYKCIRIYFIEKRVPKLVHSCPHPKMIIRQ